MKYNGVNRVFRIDEAGGKTFFYVAPTDDAAATCHATQSNGTKPKRGRTVKPVEVPADKIISVSFDDCAEAIARITGSNPDMIRPSLQGIPLADEFIAIHRAAEQWARMTRAGDSSLLTGC